jgi:L-amino acid N-acyltransferase YncA
MRDIRHASAADADAIAGLHAASWQATYRGILPDTYLRDEVGPERLAYWRAAMARGDYALVRVLCEDAKAIGFSALKTGQDEGYDYTLDHLHLLPDTKGRGFGRTLMADLARQVMATGGTSLCLWVFDANEVAVRFYNRLGGVADAHGTDKFAGGDAPDTRIGWRDLKGLVSACEETGK